MARNKKANVQCSPESGIGKGNNKKSSTPKSANGKPPRASMRLRERLTKTKKKKRLTELIVLSSSCHESNHKKAEEEKGDNASQASSPGVKVNCVNNKNEQKQYCTRVNGIEEIKAAFNNIASVIVTNNPNLSFTLTPSGLPVITSNDKAPMDSSKARTAETEKILAKFKSSKQNFKYWEPPRKLSSIEDDSDTFEDSHIKRSLFSDCEDGDKNDFYINYQPLACFPFEGRTSGVVIPEWIPMKFRPPSEMVLDEIESAVAAYVFMIDDDNEHGGEVLIKTHYGSGDRTTLKTLMPKCWIDQEVLNFLACRMTYIEKLLGPNSTIWFLPTMFAQYALDWVHTPENAMGFFQPWLGKVDYVQKIFIPINELNVHWYLLIIDFHQRKLLLLDSQPCAQRNEFRRRSVKKLALFMEEMLMHKSFHDYPIESKHFISDFSLETPIGLGLQRIGSGDCGVWVANWMIECAWIDDYAKVVVRPASRMRIALDLVLHPYNEFKDKVVEKANKYWTDLERKRKALVKI